MNEYTVSRKKRPKCLSFVISPKKLGRFWWNLVHRWVVTERNSRTYPTSTVASDFARFECNW